MLHSPGVLSDWCAPGCRTASVCPAVDHEAGQTRPPCPRPSRAPDHSPLLCLYGELLLSQYSDQIPPVWSAVSADLWAGQR